jgi:hypothetical protein
MQTILDKYLAALIRTYVAIYDYELHIPNSFTVLYRRLNFAFFL